MRHIRIADFPMSRLVADILHGSGLDRHAFIRSLGYRNETNGFRALYGCLESGFAPDFFLNNCVRVYQPAPEAWEAALRDMGQRRQEALAQERREIEQAREQRESQRREQFQPFIHVETERTVPSSIAVAALSGGSMKYIRLVNWPPYSEYAADYAPVEGFDQLDPEQRIDLVGRVVASHFQSHNGHCPLFGRISGYRYYPQYDQSLLFDVNGNVIRVETGAHPWPEMSLRIGKKSLGGALLRLLSMQPQGRSRSEPQSS